MSRSVSIADLAGTSVFRGYPRTDGLVGVRNLLLVVSMSDLANDSVLRISRTVAGSTAVLTPAGGLSYGEEAQLISRMRARLCANPNVGAVLVVGPVPAEWSSLSTSVAQRKRPFEAISLIELRDSSTVVRHGIKIAQHLARMLAAERPRRVPIEALRLGLKSSASTAASARVINRMIGRLVETVVRKGGSVAVTELADLVGDPKALVAHAATPAVGARIAEALELPRRLLMQLGPDAPDPTPLNVLGHLGTLKAKSKLAVRRLGRSRIESVLAYGDRIPEGGLHLMTGPASCASSLLGLAAAGCTLIAHTVGLTSATAVSPLAPMIKIGGPNLPASRDIDISVADRNPPAVRDILNTVLTIASGRRTASERVDGRVVMLPTNLPWL